MEKPTIKPSDESKVPKRTPVVLSEELPYPDVSVKTSYFNRTGKAVYIGLRNGMVLTLPAHFAGEGTSVEDCLIIRTEVMFSGQAKEVMKKYIDSLSTNPEAREKNEVFHQQFLTKYQKGNNWVTVKLDYRISTNELRGHGGYSYFADFDIILSLRRDIIPSHPDTASALNRDDGQTGKCGTIDIYIVDTANKIHDRFGSLVGTVTSIKKRNLPLQLDGLYVWNPDIHGPGDPGFHYAADRLDDLSWVHLTKEEAMRHAFNSSERIGGRKDDKPGRGDIPGDRRGSLDALKSELEKEANFFRTKVDQLELDREAEREKAKLLFDKTEHENKANAIRMKDFYESRSQTRKDSSELLKFIPAAIAGAVTAFIAFRTLL